MKIGIYCYVIADFFYKTLTEMFLEWSSTKHTFFVIASYFDWLPWQPTDKICEKIFKNQLLSSCLGDKAETLFLTFTKVLFFIAVAHALWLLWQLKISIDLKWKTWKLRLIAISLQIFWQKFYRNVPLVVLYQTCEFCPNCWIGLVAMVTERINLRKNIKKSSTQKP